MCRESDAGSMSGSRVSVARGDFPAEGVAAGRCFGYVCGREEMSGGR